MAVDSPEALLDAARAAAARIRPRADEIERLGELPPDVLDELRRAGAFRLAMPKAWGGPEADPLTQLRFVEEIAKADASAAWCVMVGSEGGYYATYLAEPVARTLYPDLDVVTAGFVNPAGKGQRVPRGYLVSGRWPFGSASRHAEFLVSGFEVVEGSGPPTEARVGFLPARACKVLQTWDTVGLAGSGSHDYTAEAVFVPEEHTFNFFDPALKSSQSGPLYLWPGIGLVKAAAVPLGLARAVLDRFVKFATEKKLPGTPLVYRDLAMIQAALGRAETQVGSARAYLVESTTHLWEALQRGAVPSVAERAALRLAIVNAFKASREAVMTLYEAAGGSAVYVKTGFERPLRDLLTMSQHQLVRADQIEQVGRLLLGLVPYASFL